MLNLALSENPFGGWFRGKIVNIIGDTHAGKTMLLWLTLAETTSLEYFDKYKLYYDDIEEALEFDIGHLFGSKVVKRAFYGNRFESSGTIEEMFGRVRKKLKKETFIYGVDTLDALESKREVKRTDDQLGQQAFPDKPRILSDLFKNTKKRIRKSDSLFFIVSQAKSNIGVMFGPKQRRACETPLNFYSTYVLWLAVRTQIIRRGKQVGSIVRIRITKNKVTGKQRFIELPIYYELGIDDIGSMIRWLVSEKFWKAEKETKGQIGKIKTQGDFIDGSEHKLIRYIEKNNLEDKLRNLVGARWLEVEESLEWDRKRRYK